MNKCPDDTACNLSLDPEFSGAKKDEKSPFNSVLVKKADFSGNKNKTGTFIKRVMYRVVTSKAPTGTSHRNGP